MAAFTQKHYIQLADVIHQERLKIKATRSPTMKVELETMGNFTAAMIAFFKKDNPKFNQFLFIEACSKDLMDSA